MLSSSLTPKILGIFGDRLVKCRVVWGVSRCVGLLNQTADRTQNEASVFPERENWSLTKLTGTSGNVLRNK